MGLPGPWGPRCSRSSLTLSLHPGSVSQSISPTQILAKSDGIGAFCSVIFSKESCWLQLGPGGPRGFLFSGISVPWSRVSVGGHIQDVSLLPCMYGASWLRAGTGRGLLAPGAPQRGAEGRRGALTPHGCTGDGLERDEGCCRAPKHGREVMR